MCFFKFLIIKHLRKESTYKLLFHKDSYKNWQVLSIRQQQQRTVVRTTGIRTCQTADRATQKTKRGCSHTAKATLSNAQPGSAAQRKQAAARTSCAPSMVPPATSDQCCVGRVPTAKPKPQATIRQPHRNSYMPNSKQRTGCAIHHGNKQRVR